MRLRFCRTPFRRVLQCGAGRCATRPRVDRACRPGGGRLVRHPYPRDPWRDHPPMKPLEVRIPHQLPPEEVRRRIADAVDRARAQYADTVGPIEAIWETDERMRIALNTMGMQFNGTVEVLVEELLVTVVLPGMAGLFAGRIQSGIEERLGGLLGSQQV
ncbi:MAG: hypothetical protein EBZ59_13510 [Planctomycetia bacterium]|nr:hypothetical protein [Planctomycetia bacterium]